MTVEDFPGPVGSSRKIGLKKQLLLSWMDALQLSSSWRLPVIKWPARFRSRLAGR